MMVTNTCASLYVCTVFFTSLWTSGQGRLNLIVRVMGLEAGVVRERLESCLSSAMLALQLVNLSSGVTLIIDNPSSKGVQLCLLLTSGFDLKPKRPETWSIAAQPSWYLGPAVTRVKLGTEYRDRRLVQKKLYWKPHSMVQRENKHHCQGMTNIIWLCSTVTYRGTKQQTRHWAQLNISEQLLRMWSDKVKAGVSFALFFFFKFVPKLSNLQTEHRLLN